MSRTSKHILLRAALFALVLSGMGVGGLALYRCRQETAARCHCTRASMEAIQTALMLYAKQHEGIYPSALATLMPSRDDFDCFGNGKTLNDSWGQAFAYESDGVTFKLRSSGPDMKMGTTDDIASGSARAPLEAHR